MDPKNEQAPDQPSAADLDKVAEEQKATAATSGAAVAQPAKPKPNALVSQTGTKGDTTAIDSVGAPKDASPVGPRGPSTPRDMKPAPTTPRDAKPWSTKKADQTKITTTDHTDNAGNPKHADAQQHNQVGPRGTHTVRDSYRL